jgi:glycerol-3-phosphate acyltransferase PlsX
MQFKKDFDAKEHGGSPILGLRKPVIKAHGSSDARAFKSAIRQAMRFAESGAIETIEKLLGTESPSGRE